jgi:hypothetical protein
MHVIHDLEFFLKKVEETIAIFFGKDEAGVVGYKAIKEVINEYAVVSVEAQPDPSINEEEIAAIPEEINLEINEKAGKSKKKK